MHTNVQPGARHTFMMDSAPPHAAAERLGNANQRHTRDTAAAAGVTRAAMALSSFSLTFSHGHLVTLASCAALMARATECAWAREPPRPPPPSPDAPTDKDSQADEADAAAAMGINPGGRGVRLDSMYSARRCRHAPADAPTPSHATRASPCAWGGALIVLDDGRIAVSSFLFPSSSSGGTRLPRGAARQHTSGAQASPCPPTHPQHTLAHTHQQKGEHETHTIHTD